MKIFRSGAIRHGVAPLWLLSYCCSILLPLQTFALTSGPSQPEVQAFAPAGASEMVDLFTGDFKYNIPLMDVGGYPLNLAYGANVSSEEEASWVGLGWSLNTGAVTRNLRGLPDDFNGDSIIKEFNVKPNRTFGVGVSVKPELFGFNLGAFSGEIGLGKGAFYNTYTGLGSELSVSMSLSSAQKGKSGATFGLGLNANSEKGLDVGLEACFDNKVSEADRATSTGKMGVSLGYNSREGLKQLSFDQSVGTSFLTSYSSSSRVNFAKPSYTPEIKMPMTTYSGSASVDFGTSVYGTDIMFGARGYYSEQRLTSASRSLDSYGYLYSHKAISPDALYDINREKDGAYSQDMKNLPITNFTYDVFNVDVQGCNGSFRAHRGDVGIVSDPLTKSPSYGIDIKGPEIAAAISGHVGTDLKGSADFNASGRWNTSVDKAYGFRRPLDDVEYEPYYFKKTGELSVDQDFTWFKEDLGGYGASTFEIKTSAEIQPDIGLTKGELSLGLNLKNSVDLVLPNKNRNQRNSRNLRGDLFYFLDAKEAAVAGLEGRISNYGINAFGPSLSKSFIPRTDYPDHHISEVSVLKSDGKKYVFGTPVYNTKHEEMTFNVQGNQVNHKDGLVSYGRDNEASAQNKKGIDNYFSKTTTPRYAHSFLLSAILSQDFKDIDGVEGPSDGDLGTYVKFNHTRAIQKYRWRTPYGDNVASYNEFLRTDPNDDKGSVVSGEKDVWYTHSIETPTQIAEFYISERADGKDAGTHYLYKLDSIKLYDKANRMKDLGAVAVKTAHFVYDYSLCSQTPNTNEALNSNKGKLTLKKLFFTYQNSKKGAFNPYVFNYPKSPITGNYRFAEHSNDRWGNYKPNDENLTNAEYPYVEQHRDSANAFVRAWALTSIELPTGGKINVDYEADDYGYVQDRRAMQMFKVLGTKRAGYPKNLYTSSSGVLSQVHDTLFFEIPEYYKSMLSSKLNTSQGIDTLRDLFFGDDQLAYFNFSINVKKLDENAKESVPGYFGFEKQSTGFYLDQSLGRLVGYVKMKRADLTGIGGESVTPITKAAIQFTRIHLPRELHSQPNVGENDFLSVIKYLFGLEDFRNILSATAEALNAENTLMLAGGAGKVFEGEGRSFIRLYNPIGAKLGGGHRVKKITIEDRWGDMTGSNDSFSYGQEYQYTTLAPDNKTVISSGVAAYEPFIGGEENPYRQPVFYTEDKLLAPSEQYYHEEPFGESFFPAPTVGYSKVTVKGIQYQNVKSNATGFVVNEFYTAKDFPVFTQRTGINHLRMSPNMAAISFLKVSQDDIMTVTQGYYIELNDMHGKPKGVYAYPENGKSYISSTEYRYKKKDVTLPVQLGNQTIMYSLSRLDNEIVSLNKRSSNNRHDVEGQVVGVDYDVVHDFRSNVSNLSSVGALVNVDWFMAGPFPIIVPMVLPSIDHEHTEFNSAVTTKVVRRTGILESVTQSDQGSVITVYNQSFDPNTGEPLLTKTQNQFDDSTFSFSYPAYWAYDGMEAAYTNTGRTFSNVNFSNVPNEAFSEGDELLLRNGEQLKKATVISKSGKAYVVAYNGESSNATGAEQVKILHSGKRNILTEKMGTIASLSSPVIGDQISFENILMASATTYNNNWARYCECTNSAASNPTIGITSKAYYPYANYNYLTERVLNRYNNALDLKTDGVFADFVPCWQYDPEGKRWFFYSPDAKWLPTQAVTVRNGHGEELETWDYLHRYSSAMFGYGQTLPIAVAHNTPYSGLGFDNFESYEVENCEDNHFNFKLAINPNAVVGSQPAFGQAKYSYTDLTSGPTITGGESHTGKYSIRVPSGNQVMVTKQLTSCPPKIPVEPQPPVVK